MNTVGSVLEQGRSAGGGTIRIIEVDVRDPIHGMACECLAYGLGIPYQESLSALPNGAREDGRPRLDWSAMCLRSPMVFRVVLKNGPGVRRAHWTATPYRSTGTMVSPLDFYTEAKAFLSGPEFDPIVVDIPGFIHKAVVYREKIVVGCKEFDLGAAIILRSKWESLTIATAGIKDETGTLATASGERVYCGVTAILHLDGHRVELGPWACDLAAAAEKALAISPKKGGGK